MDSHKILMFQTSDTVTFPVAKILLKNLTNPKFCSCVWFYKMLISAIKCYRSWNQSDSFYCLLFVTAILCIWGQFHNHVKVHHNSVSQFVFNVHNLVWIHLSNFWFIKQVGGGKYSYMMANTLLLRNTFKCSYSCSQLIKNYIWAPYKAVFWE